MTIEQGGLLLLGAGLLYVLGRLHDVHRVKGWVARVERESKARDLDLGNQIGEMRRKLPGEVAAVVVNELMEMVGRQKTAKGFSAVEQALLEAKAARKAVGESEEKE